MRVMGVRGRDWRACSVCFTEFMGVGDFLGSCAFGFDSLLFVLVV